MKAYEIREFGLEGLHVADLPVPEPGPSQVLVKMQAWSLNYRDLMTVMGRYNPKLRMPQIPLSDGAGDVVAVGSGVRHVKEGARVTNTFFERWTSGALTDENARTAFGAGRDGVLAEYVALHEDAVVPIPPHLSYAEAATLPCAAVTAWHALVVSGRIMAGDTILTLGTGGVSIFSLQFAQLHGAQVIITSSNDAKLAKARQLGASGTINYIGTPDWGKKVRELTKNGGVDQVVELGGRGTFNQSVASLKRGGILNLIGVLSLTGEADILPVLMNGIRVQGIFVGSRAMFTAMNKAIGMHRMHPIVDRIFGFEEAKEAFRHMEAGKHFGKICIQI